MDKKFYIEIDKLLTIIELKMSRLDYLLKIYQQGSETLDYDTKEIYPINSYLLDINHNT